MKKFKLLLAAALFALAGTASAAPITGHITFGGHSTGFDITANTVSIEFDRGLVTGASEIFSDEGVLFGDVAVYNSFGYSPISSAAPLWSVDGFEFELTQITLIDEATAGHLSLEGLGRMTHADYDSTLYHWSFSVDSTGVFAYSATNTAVPEPAILLLLATGLIGFGFARRKAA